MYELNSAIDETEIKISIENLKQSKKPQKSSFVFAFYEQNENFLYKYDPAYGELEEENDGPLTIGSLNAQFNEYAEYLFDYLEEKAEKLSDDDILVLINTTYQNIFD